MMLLSGAGRISRHHLLTGADACLLQKHEERVLLFIYYSLVGGAECIMCSNASTMALFTGVEVFFIAM